MKKLLYIFSFLFIANSVIGQIPSNATCDEAFEIPYAFSYSGFILFEDFGQVNTNGFQLQASITEDSPDGNILLVENHTAAFQKTGFFNIKIGSQDEAAFIDVILSMNEAQTKDYFIVVKLRIGTQFITIGSKQIQTVPYALVANSLQGIGPKGEDGRPCWDTNNNGQPDPSEDINNDGSFNEFDCIGPTGPTGATGATAPTGATGLTGQAGVDGFGRMVMRSTPPTSYSTKLYVDDGTNTADGKPHLRHRINSNQPWIDL